MRSISRFHTPAKVQSGFSPLSFDAIGRARQTGTVMALLRALDIIEIRFHLSGGGDSGDCEISAVIYADGRETTQVPRLPIGFNGAGNIEFLDIFLENFASDLPEGDWVNNEGGHGDVSIYPNETDEDRRFACDMTYGDDEDEGDDDYDDEDGEEDTDIDDILRDIGITPRFGGIAS